MNRINLILTIVFSLTLHIAIGQTIDYCGYDQYEEAQLSADSNYLNEIKKIEKKYRHQVNNPAASSRADEYVLPIVVHIVHNNGPENINDVQVSDLVAQLNDAFANTNEYTSSEGIDTEIMFCLAQRDEDGEDFTGIVRHETIYTDMSIFAGFDYVQGLIIDPSQYINIQIVSNACLGSNCDVAGFAGGSRIVIEYDAITGAVPNISTLAHEMGHYLGLKHTFHNGCQNNDCLADGDKVCDTPPDNRTFDHCFFEVNSCNSDEDDSSINNPFRSVALGGLGDQDDQHSNYMDYNFRECRENFTQGQADRMHFFIENKYESLMTSKACLPACDEDPLASFTPDTDMSVNVGESITFTNTSSSATSYGWYYDGDSISNTIDLSFPFTEEGLHTITLSAFNNLPECDTSYFSITIEVVCPVIPDFDYLINNSQISFNDLSEFADNVAWTINDADANILMTSSNSSDLFDFSGYEFIQLCIEASNAFCSSSYCEFITLINDGSEICNDGVDNDDDGFVDLYDQDCSCEEMAFQAQCEPDCVILPDSFPEITMKIKWESEITLDNIASPLVYTENGSTYIQTTKNVVIDSTFGFPNFDPHLIYLDGATGETIDTLEVSSSNTHRRVIFRENTNSDIITFIADSDSIFKIENNVKTESVFVGNRLDQVKVHDINGDGIAEIAYGTSIFNSNNLAKLYSGTEGQGCQGDMWTDCIRTHTVIGDFLDSPGLEMAAGNTIYSFNITNLNGEAGNTVTIAKADGADFDGVTSMGDINGDAALDVIAVRDPSHPDGGQVTVWDPRNGQIIAAGESFRRGLIAVVSDLDGDCNPELGVTYEDELVVYKYDNTNVLKILYRIPTDDFGSALFSTFDLNRDGRKEILFRDQSRFCIFNGENGDPIVCENIRSQTSTEFPIVVDVNGDRSAEILISGYTDSRADSRLFCFESADVPWAPARSVWNQYGYIPTLVNDDLTIPRYPQNQAVFFDTDSCAQFTCPQPYNSYLTQATYRTQQGCAVWPNQELDLAITASATCVGDSIEICLYATSTDTTTITEGVPVVCYPSGLGPGNGDQWLDRVTIYQDTTCITYFNPGYDSIHIFINDGDQYYPPNFPSTNILECDYTNNEFILELTGPDFSIDIIDYDCTSDSLIFYIATNNIGVYTDVDCIEGGCYFVDPALLGMNGGVVSPLEVTSWCFEYDTATMMYQYQDTFRVAIPTPVGQSEMWWTINEGGFGPGLASSEMTGIYECNYNNNVDHISFDNSEKVLDLGPDITKCMSEVFTLDAGSEFESYLWNDLTTEMIYSSSYEGLHYIEAIDQCGRIYMDSITVTFDNSNTIDLGEDIILCTVQDTTISILGDYDEIHWFPSGAVDCDTCSTVLVSVDTLLSLVVSGTNNNCASLDTINIERIIPEIDSVQNSYCYGDTIDFFDQQVFESGAYTYVSLNCDSIIVLDASFIDLDTTLQEEQICESDSMLFNGTYYKEEGIYSFHTQNQFGCDSLVLLELLVVDILEISDTLTICQGDSIDVFGQWISSDSIIVTNQESAAGCDSMHTINVVVEPLLLGNIDQSICEGDSIYLYDMWFSEDGDYTVQKSNSMGCDSLIDINIMLRSIVEDYDTIMFCKGDTLDVLGFMITESTDVSQSYNASNGCDSTIHVHVQEILPVFTEEEILLCQGDSILIDEEWIHNVGIYDQIHTSSLGCDSIHSITINELTDISEPTLEIDCDNETVIVSIDQQSGWMVVWDNGDTTAQTSYKDQAQANLTLYAEPNCEKKFTIELPRTPKFDQVEVLEDTIVQVNTQLAIDLNINQDEWSVLWLPTEVIDCDTCARVTINAQENVEISVYFTHESGCIYESTFDVEIENEKEGIFVPNVFSPNSDNINDNWKIMKTENIQILSINVFDRWGNLVYHTNDSEDSWNGTIGGKNSSQGVYVYSIHYLDNTGKQFVKSGDITIVR